MIDKRSEILNFLSKMGIDLKTIFLELNQAHFGGALELPQLSWNSRFKTTSGRFTPGRIGHRGFRLYREAPLIEVASYFQEELNGHQLASETLAHEMIHYWLWVNRRPYGHTAEFIKKMKQIGAKRYSQAPRIRPPKYLYSCLHCKREYPARKRWARNLACYQCCQKYNRGRFDARFRIVLVKRLSTS